MRSFALLADVVVVLHLLFVVFVIAGGLLAIRWKVAAMAHLPAAVWGALIEFGGWICPLTPLENSLRSRAGEATYRGGFVDHYVLPLLYPRALDRDTQWILGGFVVAVNVIVYCVAWRRHRRRNHSGAGMTSQSS